MASGKFKDRPELKTIVLKYGAGVAELLSAWLILRVGGGTYWSWTKTPRLRFVEDAEAARGLCPENEHTVWIGFGGGDFDLYDVEGNLRVQDMTLADVVADRLKVLGLPELKMHLEECRDWVLKRRKQREFEPGFVIADILEYGVGDQNDENFRELMRGPDGIELRHRAACQVAFADFDAKFGKALEFHKRCPREFEMAGELCQVGSLNVAIVSSDLRPMSAWCRGVLHANAVILTSPTTGHMRIFTDEGKGRKSFESIVFALLDAEWAHMVEEPSPDEWNSFRDQAAKLLGDGEDFDLPGAEHWRVRPLLGMMLNSRGIVTRCTAEQIVELLVEDLT